MTMNQGSGKRVRSLRELPQAMTPARDLWPEIEAQLAPRRRSWVIPASVAASFLVAAVGLSIAFLSTEELQTPAAQTASTQAPVQSSAPQDSGAMIRAALMSDPEYVSQREQLLRELPGKIQRLPTESQQRVRDSLIAIQNAMRDIEAELGRDSGNALLQEMLVDASQEEMRVLTAVNEAQRLEQEI